MPLDLEPPDPENICCHCNEYFTGEGYVTTANDLLCDACAAKMHEDNEEWIARYGHRSDGIDTDPNQPS